MPEQSRPGPSIVLVVEDDPILMFAMVSFVEDAGCEAIEATTVPEALRILEGRTDVRTVFTDLDMRGSTAGMNLALAIRDRWPPIELLLIGSRPVSAGDMPARGILVGKPFDSDKIVSTIRRLAA